MKNFFKYVGKVMSDPDVNAEGVAVIVTMLGLFLIATMLTIWLLFTFGPVVLLFAFAPAVWVSYKNFNKWLEDNQQ